MSQITSYSGKTIGKRGAAPPPVTFPGAAWSTKTPAELGMNATNIASLETAIGGAGFLVKDGYQVAEWGTYTTNRDWASAAKPLHASMALIAKKEGLITDLDDLVGNHGQAVTGDDTTMTFRHLTNMLSGYMRPEIPGGAFAYNDYAVSLFCDTLYDQVGGVFETAASTLINNRLASLQFEDGSLILGRGGFGLNASPRDFCRIGWWWLNKFNWNGTALIPESDYDAEVIPQVAGATAITSGTDSADYLAVGTFGGTTDQSSIGPGIYGLAFWHNSFMFETTDRMFPNAPADLYLAQGHFGPETLAIIPSLGLVCAADGSWGNLATDAGVSGSTMDSRMELLASTVN